MNKTPRELGIEAENAAAAYLERRGVSIITRNYRRRWGEVDIIAMDSDVLVFIEVKAGRNQVVSPPALRVGYRKQRRLISAAKQFLQENALNPEAVRFDVLELVLVNRTEWRIEHIQDAFRLEDEDFDG